MDSNNSQYSLISAVFLSLVAILECGIGLFLHIKIIRVSARDKDLTWKLDATNSSILIFLYMIVIFVYVAYNLIDDFYTYTGDWFCVASKVLIYYGMLYILWHSLFLSILKYCCVVHWKKVRDFDRERLIDIFFWINLLHPVVTIAFNLLTRPDFFTIGKSNKCLWKENIGHGNEYTSRHKFLTFEFCNFTIPNVDDYGEYLLYLLRTGMCGLQVIILWLNAWNILEILFYWRTFDFLRR